MVNRFIAMKNQPEKKNWVLLQLLLFSANLDSLSDEMSPEESAA